MVNLERIKQRLDEYQEFSKNKKLESVNLKDKILVDYIISNKEYPFQFEDELNTIKNMNDTDLLKFIIKENRWNLIQLFLLKNDPDQVSKGFNFGIEILNCLNIINELDKDQDFKLKYYLYSLNRLHHYLLYYDIINMIIQIFTTKMLNYLVENDIGHDNYNLIEELIKNNFELIPNKIYQTICNIINEKDFSNYFIINPIIL